GPAVVVDVPVTFRPDGLLVLTPDAADLSGRSLKVEEKDGKPNLGHWTSQDAAASWFVRIPKDGRYAIEIDLACADGDEGDRFDLEISGQKAGDAVPATGGWEKFTTMKLGTVTLKPGDQRLKLTAAPGLKGALMNVREIRFAPADQGW
ncbi:MAG: carbohydrate-binding protein, partial [Phycisphaerales bacterium]